MFQITKEKIKEITSFSKEFLDYYDLNDLTLTYTQHIIQIVDNTPSSTKTYKTYNTKTYKPYNLNIYKDRLVSFLQNFTSEFELETGPALITIYSHKQDSLIKTIYFDLKSFSNTSITEPIDYIELKLIQKNSED